jgi:hypothetical protein
MTDSFSFPSLNNLLCEPPITMLVTIQREKPTSPLLYIISEQSFLPFRLVGNNQQVNIERLACLCYKKKQASIFYTVDIYCKQTTD